MQTTFETMGRRIRSVCVASLLAAGLLANTGAHAGLQEKPTGAEDPRLRDRVDAQRPTGAAAADFDEASAIAAARHASLRDGIDGVDDNALRVRIRYPVALGYRDASGLFDPQPTSCNAFQLSAAPVHAKRDDSQPVLIGIAARPGMRREGDNYVCEYVVSDLPLDVPIRVQATIGSARQRSTEPWQGGELSRPPLGQYRTVLDDTRELSLSAGQAAAAVDFRMAYAGGIPNGGFAERASEGRGDAVAAALAKPAPDPPICAYARSARARNSPAAPSLERQCREYGGTPH